MEQIKDSLSGMTTLDDEQKTRNSVDKALDILRIVAESDEGLTLSDVARSSMLPVTTVARHLKTLERAEFLFRGDSATYRPGRVLVQLGAQTLSRYSLYELAEKHLKAISEYTGETAYLAVISGKREAVYLRQVESSRAIRHASWAGKTIDTTGTAIGAALENDVGPRGFACSRATRVEPDAAAVAAPIMNSSGEIVAAISVIGPSFRLSEQDLQTYGVFIRKHVVELSKQLI
ncbi:IclR family transcriptional regulator [Leucobacter sp. UCMA 4100]|uniref:IclR family transcriptional regulator n=1 Tax=Leucobacter sp. UCMA 4100 TaxID=2810534 RepID=UPI0022EAE85C|nr:IclR family transcriptional regulator [Leucobacter sp. UCMA 4100]MDA3146714.1 IclR family transcriptional regulator [Leucobacter sp. UCMA 4100]